MKRQPRTDANTELINLAYSLAIEPQRLNDFTKLLNIQAEKLAQINEDDRQEVSENLSNTAIHFQHAFDLAERQGRRFNYATGSMRFIDFDVNPSALIREDGIIFHANQPAIDELNFIKLEKLPKNSFTNVEYKRFLNDLKQLSKHETDKIISVYSLTRANGEPPIKMALSKSIDYNNKPIGRLSTFHIKWLAEHGKLFQESFGLTDVDIDITKAIITGLSLKKLAANRGRALATIRNQTKALFAKLGLYSQVELACLFSGFTHFNLNVSKNINTHLPKLQSEPWRKTHKLEMPDGREIQYEIVGPPNGRNVLYFHALIGGLIITKAIREELKNRNIRLIMVWRPFFAGSSPDNGSIKGSTKRFARDVETLLDKLMIDNCQIIGQIEGAIYAYGCAHYIPKRVLAIVNCASSIPILKPKHFKDIHPLPRATLLIARYAPLLLPMVTRSVLSKVDAGYDEEFILEFFAPSTNDLAMFDDPELKMLMRNAYPIYTLQGYITYVKTALVEVSKWQYLLENMNCPVTLIHGEQDSHLSISAVENFISNKPNISLHRIPNGGQMLFYQHSKTVFEKLDEQFLKLTDKPK